MATEIRKVSEAKYYVFVDGRKVAHIYSMTVEWSPAPVWICDESDVWPDGDKLIELECGGKTGSTMAETREEIMEMWSGDTTCA
jgi:hypothetical protein